MCMPGRFLRLLAIVAGLGLAAQASAQSTWRFNEIYSNFDGTIQFVVVYDQSGNTNNQNVLTGMAFESIHNSAEHAHDPGFVTTFDFPNNLPSTQTAGKQFLIATRSFAALNLVTPDFIVDNQFIPQLIGVLSLVTGPTGQIIIDSANYPAIPNDSVNALYRDGSIKQNVATNFAGQSASVPANAISTVPSVEYYYADWNYYFMTADPAEIALLDGGAFNGNWKRTGQTFNVWPFSSATASPTCRFFSTPLISTVKSSHFYTPFPTECATVQQNPDWEYESIAFYIALADANGSCADGTNPIGTVPLYRAYNNGLGGAPNHRYTTSLTILNQMIAAGWVAEGDGTPPVFACVPQ